jgi:hypothetical protein
MAAPPLQRPQARQKVEYRKPRKINVVSVTMTLLLAAAGYVVYSLYPLFQLRANAKAEMMDALPHLWRYNRRPSGVATPELVKLKANLTERLVKVTGIKDPKMKVTFVRGKEVVAIEVTFRATATFPHLDKRVDLDFAPRVETDAAHIEW